MDELVLAFGRITSGLLAGTYAAFLLAVMPALHRQTDDVFVAVMNRINVAIVNPAFVTLFLGAPLLAAALLRWQRTPTAVAALVAALAALVITVAANLPLNKALADDGARGDFERPWVFWHAMRTIAATAAFTLLCLTTLDGPA